jgi:hypothetical protein
MTTFKLGLGFLLIVAALSGAARAQAQRTFVASGGSDGNPCSRTAPCRTFRQAISQTNPGGEVIALDSAGYGTFSVDRTISIIAPPGVYAGISVFSGVGIDINAGPSDTVILRGLTINGQGGDFGVFFIAGNAVYIENSVVNGFFGTGNREGIRFTSAGRLTVKDSTIRNNDVGIHLSGNSAAVIASMDQVRLEGNVFGLVVNDIAVATVRASVMSGNATACATIGSGSLDLEGCLITNNTSRGIEASNVGGLLTLSNTTLTHNGEGYHVEAGSSIFSRGNNTVVANGSNTGVLTQLPGQ